MANKKLFRSMTGNRVPPATAVNQAGGLAYALAPQAALAQYAATGCLNGTYYATAESSSGTVLALCAQVEPAFIARTAVYCRERGYMKDMPALLCAVLATGTARCWRRSSSASSTTAACCAVRPDGALRPDGAPVARHAAEAPGAALARAAGGRSAVPGLGGQRAVAGGRDQDGASRPATRGAPGALRLPDRQAARRGGAARASARFRALQGRPPGRAPGGAVPDADGARPGPGRVDGHRAPRDLAADAAAPGNLRASRRVRRARSGRASGGPAARSGGHPAGTGVPVPANGGARAGRRRGAHGRAGGARDGHGGRHRERADDRRPGLRAARRLGLDAVAGHRVPQGATSKVRCVDVAALVAAALVRKNPRAEVLPFEQDVVSALTRRARQRAGERRAGWPRSAAAARTARRRSRS